MITILFAYRNRDINRIQKSLDSLSFQTNKNFKVIFVDYGSDPIIANEVVSLMSSYPYLQYFYLNTSSQPWNKSKALNYAIKKSNSDFCFAFSHCDFLFFHKFKYLSFNFY